MLAVGLMSGTSLDGIDAALVRIEPREPGYVIETVRTETYAFNGEFAAGLRDAMPPAEPAPARIAELDAELGALLGDAAYSVARDAQVDFVAAHGVTLYHDGDRALTWQIGNPFAIRERSSATVLYDFRRADCAAGGQGAPLVPYADALLFSAPERFRVAINLGGIANATLLPPGAGPEDLTAWDTGPGNMLIDAFVRGRTAGAEVCDRGGEHATRGRVDGAALDAMLGDAYFARRPPKSTGRERFGTHFLAEHAAVLATMSLEDGCATLTALTARTLADSVLPHLPSDGDAIVAGGGVHNRALMAALAEALGGWLLVPSSRFGVDPDFKEAIAFALLGYELLRGRPAGLPAVTGARTPEVLGAIVPVGLARLLGRLREELTAHAAEQAAP